MLRDLGLTRCHLFVALAAAEVATGPPPGTLGQGLQSPDAKTTAGTSSGPVGSPGVVDLTSDPAASAKRTPQRTQDPIPVAHRPAKEAGSPAPKATTPVAQSPSPPGASRTPGRLFVQPISTITPSTKGSTASSAAAGATAPTSGVLTRRQKELQESQEGVLHKSPQSRREGMSLWETLRIYCSIKKHKLHRFGPDSWA